MPKEIRFSKLVQKAGQPEPMTLWTKPKDNPAFMKATTRAPVVLAELKSSLGNIPGRFARAVVQPLLVDRELRARFDDDPEIHAVQRAEAAGLRKQIIAAQSNGSATDALLVLLRQNATNEFSESVWQLGTRPVGDDSSAPPDQAEIHRRFGSNAQLLSAPGRPDDGKFYFSDLPPELQNILRLQLRRAGAVSDVIETPHALQLYLLVEKDEHVMKVAVLTVAKQSFEGWLATQ